MAWDIQFLFRSHAGAITRSLRRRGIDAETAADLTQDTFLRVLLAPPSEAAANHNPEAYLHRVVRNLRIDHERRQRLVKWVTLPDQDFAQIADPSASAEAVVYGREKLDLVAKALRELPERQRHAFALHRIEGLTMAEVARRLDISTSGAWGLIRDAYSHLDARLSGL